MWAEISKNIKKKNFTFQKTAWASSDQCLAFVCLNIGLPFL